MNRAIGSQGRNVVQAASGDGERRGSEAGLVGCVCDGDGIAMPTDGFVGGMGDVEKPSLGAGEEEVEGASHFPCGGRHGVFVGHSFEGGSFFDLAKDFLEKTLSVGAKDPRNTCDQSGRVPIENGLFTRELGLSINIVGIAVGGLVLEA